MHVGDCERDCWGVKKVYIGENYSCPACVDKHNWLGNDGYHDWFTVKMEGTKAIVSRSGSNEWGMNLKIKC